MYDAQVPYQRQYVLDICTRRLWFKFLSEILKVNRAHLAELHKPIDIHCPAVETDEGVAEIWICRTLQKNDKLS